MRLRDRKHLNLGGQGGQVIRAGLVNLAGQGGLTGEAGLHVQTDSERGSRQLGVGDETERAVGALPGL